MKTYREILNEFSPAHIEYMDKENVKIIKDIGKFLNKAKLVDPMIWNFDDPKNHGVHVSWDFGKVKEAVIDKSTLDQIVKIAGNRYIKGTVNSSGMGKFKNRIGLTLKQERPSLELMTKVGK